VIGDHLGHGREVAPTPENGVADDAQQHAQGDPDEHDADEELEDGSRAAEDEDRGEEQSEEHTVDRAGARSGRVAETPRHTLDRT